MAEQGITALGATNFKSLRDESRIEIRPLTILAGANSSGKSSIMQPLLLLKQTLDATYDPGPLLIDGPNVRFTEVKQFLWSANRNNSYQNLGISVDIEQDHLLTTFEIQRKQQQYQIQLNSINYELEVADVFTSKIYLHKNMSAEQIEEQQSPRYMMPRYLSSWEDAKWRLKRNRCFFELELVSGDEVVYTPVMPTEIFIRNTRLVIHVPGIRGNPERTYRTTAATGPAFPGTFEPYVASIISRWQIDQDNRLDKLGSLLEILGLTKKVTAKRIDDTQVELQVARLPLSAKGSTRDMVSIADVGFGVSQVLPVLVALLAAEPGQLVYLEQPEIHLHPRAQVALAQVLADAANRGVRVVAETHSDLFLLGVQTLVAAGKLAPEKVKLHWFSRGDDGATTISSRDLDETGSYGDWPEDFGETTLTAQSHFMDAAEAHQPEN